jgi:TRAP-type C4-dicarboxylate transport system substrate-binding protein
MATVAPEGTAWAREFRSMTREVEQVTGGEVRFKWYFGGMAGDELEVGERIRKGQLDGTASGEMLCERIAPSLRVMRVLGVFQSRSETSHIIHSLHSVVAAEAHTNGYTLIAHTGLGPDVIFSRTPVRSMADLKSLRVWRWDLDDVGIRMSRALGINIVPTPIAQATKAYEEGRVDAFIAIPTAALAFQWSSQARYITDLRMGYLTGCLLIANRAFDQLPANHQQTVLRTLAKYDARFEDLGRSQDDALLGGLFERQGLRPVPPSEVFRAEFFEAAKKARDQLDEAVVPHPLLEKVLNLLSDFRAVEAASR